VQKAMDLEGVPCYMQPMRKGFMGKICAQKGVNDLH
jgi:hypothetical protein